MMFVNVMSIIMLLFSLILLVIAFIVAAFSIASGIAEDIATIGALKSVGYKNKILRTGQIVQYLLIALFGSAAGALISLAAFGFIGNIIAGTSGLLWTAGVNVLPLLFSILIVGALTALTGLLATGRFKKITPINALRGGDSHHSFKKNRMPLDKRPKMPLDLQLGFKRFFTGIKSNIVLAVVMSLLVFICTMVNAASYNLNDDQSVMINMIGLEMSELWIMSGPDTDIDAVNTRLNAYPEVTRTMLLGTVDGCKIDGVTTGLETAEDYTKFEINPFVRGGTPLEDDEIALCATQSGLTGKDVGDRVRVEYGGKTEEFRVSGIIQGLGNTETARITYSAMTKLFPDFKPDSIYTYLNDGVNTEAFISRLKNDFGNKIVILNTEKQVADVLASLGGPFAAITWVMVIVTVIVTAFMLFLMISTLIRKAKKEFGILKAIGFKTGRLILQLLISYLPALVLGAVAGVILGFTVTNPLFSVFFAGMNLPKTYFLTPVLPALGIGAGILAASALTIYLVGLRLRKISPQKLIREN